MNQMTVSFLRLMEIIGSKQNSISHIKPLARLIINFESVYFANENKTVQKIHADVLIRVLTTLLLTKLKDFNDRT